MVMIGGSVEASWCKWKYPELSKSILALEFKANGMSNFKVGKFNNYVFFTIESELPIDEVFKTVKSNTTDRTELDILNEKTVFGYYKNYNLREEKLSYICTFFVDSIAESIKVVLDVECLQNKEKMCEIIEHLLNKTCKVKHTSYRLK